MERFRGKGRAERRLPQRSQEGQVNPGPLDSPGPEECVFWQRLKKRDPGL